ncbi:MAG: PAS domain S-box protein [Acidobacteria bacterium]|nr:PAS domain S-box protein [Acidobacteriota bacterium]
MHTLNRAHTDGPGLTVLTAVCDRAPHLAGLLDLDGRIVHASPRTCALVGCTLDDVRDRAVWDSPWWAHDTQAQVDIRDGVARARHAPVEFETTHRNTLGEIRAIDLTLTPVDDGAGRTYLLVDGRDITDRLKADDTLARVNRQLRMLSDCNQALVRATEEPALLEAICAIVVSVGGYRMAWAGDADPGPDHRVRPVAHAGDEGGYLSEVCITWDERPTGRGPIGTAIRTGLPCAIQNVATDDRFSPWMAAASRHGYAAVCGLPMVADGRTLGALAVYSERADAFDPDEVSLLQELADDLAFGIVTVRLRNEQLRASEQLRANEKRFRKLMSNSHDITIVMDAHGRLTHGSGAITEILGYEAETLMDVNGFDLVHPDDLATARSVFAEAARPLGELHRIEFRARHNSGSWVWLEAVGTNLLDDAVVRGVVMNMRDITDRRRAEADRQALQNQLQQAMKMEAVGRLAGGIAHDFNNLLTAINGNLEIAQLDLSPADPLMASITHAMRAAQSAAGLTRQLLSFSRRQILEPRVVNLNELLTELRKMLVRLLGEDVRQTFALAPDLAAVQIDPGQFEQVIVNLAVNARDAMPDGGTLTIETANVDLDDDYVATHPHVTAGPYVMLSVSDTGHGMPPEVRQRLFEPFFTTKPKGRGTGLGLATIFGAVKQAGGTIEVYSEVDRGSAFKIYLPRVSAPVEPLVKPTVFDTLPHGRETILLVEDDPTVRHVAVSFLRRLGYTVRIAANGDEAIMRAQAGGIDLLLTDVVMPGINGQELATRLRAAHPDLRVLFTSGYTENTIAHHGVVDPHTDFIGKPFGIHALATKIRDVLDRPRA